MTDKEKIRAEIERLKESGCASPIVICDTLLSFIDSMPVEPKFKVGNVVRSSNGTILTIIGLGQYCYHCDNDYSFGFNIQDEFELVEEPVSEKKCIFTKDNYTDEDRKTLCEDCKEKCEYSKEFKEAMTVLETDMVINQKHNMKNYPDSIYLAPIWFNDDKLLSEFWYDSPVSSKAIEYVSKDKTIKNVIKKTIEWIKYNNENGGCDFDGWENDLRCTLIND